MVVVISGANQAKSAPIQSGDKNGSENKKHKAEANFEVVQTNVTGIILNP